VLDEVFNLLLFGMMLGPPGIAILLLLFGMMLGPPGIAILLLLLPHA
jgi:hypothetical protein